MLWLLVLTFVIVSSQPCLFQRSYFFWHRKWIKNCELVSILVPNDYSLFSSLILKPYSERTSFLNDIAVTILITQGLWFYVPIQTGLTSPCCLQWECVFPDVDLTEGHLLCLHPSHMLSINFMNYLLIKTLIYY